MSIPDPVIARWRAEVGRALPTADRDLVEEVALHVAERWAAGRREGLTATEADRAAFADLDLWRSRVGASSVAGPSAWRRATSGLALDLKAMRRAVARRPSATVAAAVLVALALAANLAVVALAYGILVRPLPYPRPDRLMTLWQSVHGELGQVSYPDLVNLRETGAFEVSGAIMSGFGTLITESTADRVQTVYVEPAVLSLLGAHPAVGRLLESDDNAKQLVMISHKLWLSRFGGETSVVGRSFSLSGEPYTIVGVLPRGVNLELPVGTAFTIDQPDVWMALDRTQSFLTRREVSTYEVLARLSPNVSAGQAQSMIDSRGRLLAREFVSTNHDRDFRLVPLQQQMVDGARRPMVLAAGAAVLVLIVALANLTTLALARRRDREAELTVRQALGASRWKVLRQWILESSLVTMIGGAIGAVAGRGLTSWLIASRGAHLPRLDAVRFDAPVILCGLGILALVGLLPALWSAPLAYARPVLRADERTIGRSTRRSRRFLVAGEIAVALTLATSASLCGLTLVRLLSVNPGFERDRAVTMRVSAYATRYPTQEATVRFFTSLADHLETLPGVDGAAVTFTLPLSRQSTGTNVMSAERPRPPAERLNVGWQMTSPGYFHAVGIPIVRGRDFRADDQRRPRHPTIISESVARGLFGEADPIGRLVSVGGGEAQADWHEVVGVVGDVRHAALAEPPLPRVYDAFGPHWERTMFLVVRARSGVDPASLTSAARATIEATDPTAPIFEVATMSDLVDRSVAGRRVAALLAAGLAIGSLLLALVGTYAVVACAVSERQRELGVRVALGATRRRILGLVLGETLVTALSGCAVGIAGAALAAHALAGQLFSVRPADAAPFIGLLVVGLAMASLLAAWWPARRAARVDPLIAIRE